jgi:hypothetical protein
MSDTPWIKASRSDTQGNDCVELRRHGGMVEVRDSKDVGPSLRFTDAEFAAWLHGAKHGEFDHLVPPT